MTAFSFAWLCLSALVGYLVWRGSKSIWRAVLAGLVLPTAAIVVFVAVIGKSNLEGASPAIFLIGTIAALAVLVFALRDRQ